MHIIIKYHYASRHSLKAFSSLNGLYNSGITNRRLPTQKFTYHINFISSALYSTAQNEIQNSSQLPPNYWEDFNNRKKFLAKVANKLNIKRKNDWYRVTLKDLTNIGGGLLQKYDNNLSLVLSSVYPEYEWLPWRFRSCPSTYWDDVNNQRKFMEWAEKELKIKEMNDWFKNKDFYNVGGRSLLESKYNNSLTLLLSTMFPNKEYSPWNSSACPKYFWNDENNQRKFLEWAGKELKIKEMSDWYKVTLKDLLDIGGRGLLKKYNHSPYLLLSAVYPQYNWLPWKFGQTPKNYWALLSNQRKFVDWLGNELGVKEMSDWYKVKYQDYIDKGGESLLKKYNMSPPKLLSAVYPEHEWLPWQFDRCTQSYWDDNSKRKFLLWAGNQLGIKEFSDWQNVSTRTIIDMGGYSLFPENDLALPKLLSLVFPEHDSSSFLNSKKAINKKTQSLLKTITQAIFPQEEMFEDYRHPDIFLLSGKPLELDLFFPRLNLAFEYQGIQHYKNVRLFSRASSLEQGKARDMAKIELCKEKGITLIEVPYWWDRKYDSLAATVYSQRPDLFNEAPSGRVIPPTEDSSRKEMRSSKAKSALITATEWDYESMDPSGWYMTEKYDGMRLYWNGSDFYTRQGKKVKVPEFIKSQMPKEALDGELWTQYGLYQGAVSLFKRGDEEKWKKAVYWVFDAPDMADKPYEERITFLKELKFSSFVQVIEPVKCESKEHLKQYFDSIVAKGGEGVMLREPGSVYKAGRSTSLRKFKPYFDTEVKVIENNYPHGFNCVQMNGRDLFVGISENYTQAKAIKKGAVITVKHLGTNVHGTLQYPKFYRERMDVKWEDLINT